ncbi:MAG: PadR family transcriptional regulator [Gemmatimonadota bacterium]|jgi:DNA-binding PadR family transcriptional regulator
MSTDVLGDFEKMVLLAILQLGGESYGAPILEEIETRTGQTPSSGSLYVALRRMEKRGLLSSSFGDPTPERGGRAKRFFRVQPEALRLLRRSQEIWESMAQGLGPVLEGES